MTSLNSIDISMVHRQMQYIILNFTIFFLTSRQYLAAKRKRNREKAKCYRSLIGEQTKTKRLQRQVEKYRKRCNRALKKLKQAKSDSPRTKTTNLLAGCIVTKEVERTLDFHHVLISSIKQKPASKNIVAGRILKRYRMQHALKMSTGLSRIRQYRENGIKRSVVHTAGEHFKKNVQEFYCRDDNSRMTPGKKQTVTKKKKKMQKRLLCDSLMNLHRKFLTDNPSSKISYSLFCKLRPFWVVVPSSQDRETCLCKTHENLEFMASTLHQKLKLLPTGNVEVLADSVVCDPKQKGCMYGECADCKNQIVEMPRIDDGHAEVRFHQWQTVTEAVPGSQDNRTCVVTKKMEVTSNKHQIQDDFNNRLLKFRRHLFNIRHQFSKCRELRKDLQKSECIIHIDFSENFSGKYSREIQSVHFGGSHKQVTLHTGMLYVSGVDEGIAFCTVSPSRRHDPIAIWAYLEPLFQYMKESHPDIQTIHFFSDGPTTQYRQKGNFYLFSHKVFSHGYVAASWNFWEASHGKGAPDGVGGGLEKICRQTSEAGI